MLARLCSVISMLRLPVSVREFLYPCGLSDLFTASIRAYGAQEAFRKQSMERIDKYTRAARTL